MTFLPRWALLALLLLSLVQSGVALALGGSPGFGLIGSVLCAGLLLAHPEMHRRK